MSKCRAADRTGSPCMRRAGHDGNGPVACESIPAWAESLDHAEDVSEAERRGFRRAIDVLASLRDGFYAQSDDAVSRGRAQLAIDCREMADGVEMCMDALESAQKESDRE